MAQYVKVGVRPDNIVTYEYLKPIENADIDLEVMKYITSEIMAIITKKKLKKVKVLGDITKYKRHDCVSITGFDFPPLKSRKYVIQTFKKLGYIKVAYFKKSDSVAINALLRFVTDYIPTKLKLFISKAKAVAWLKKA